jgi:CBS domain-containing protein
MYIENIWLIVAYARAYKMLVDDCDSVVGFVLKSDVVRFDSTGGDPTYARLSEIATRCVVTIRSTEPIKIAAETMLHENVHHLAVEDNHDLVGVVSSFDFVKLAASTNGASPSAQ